MKHKYAAHGTRVLLFESPLRKAYLGGLAGARESGLAACAVGPQRDEAGESVAVTGFDGELVLVPPRPVLGRGKRELQDLALVHLRPGHILRHAVSREDLGHGDLVGRGRRIRVGRRRKKGDIQCEKTGTLQC